MKQKTLRLQLLLEQAEKQVEGTGYSHPSPIASLPWNQEVGESQDLERILRVPRRVWSQEQKEVLAARLTPLLAKEEGSQTLRPDQAVALHDFGAYRALVCTARVGMGKTLVTLLAPYMIKSVRPLILVPAALREKTYRDMKVYRKHWEIAEFIRIESYELLARKEHSEYLERYRPDSIICDEAHKLRNTKAAVTKRIKRYLQEIRPNTPLALLSGTLMNRSLWDFWHLLRWTLPYESCPLPHNYDELDMWSAAVDEKIGALNRVGPGALLKLCSEEEKFLAETEPVKAVRSAVGRRIIETAGVVTTKETFEGASLQIAPVKLDPPEIIRQAFKKIRKFELPSGEPLADSDIQANRARQLILGFYYEWSPPPPEEWLKKRKEWCKACRKILSHNRRNLDTEAQVCEAIEGGFYDKHRPAYEEWLAIKDTFKIHTKAVWIHDYAIDYAIKWGQENKGIIWVSHKAVGKRLEEKSGFSYYGEDGLDAGGRFIEDHPKGEAIVASIKANKDGKNLQYKWHKNLVLSPPSSGLWWEQMIGRTHREGQEEDTVYFDVFSCILEHIVAFHKARGDAKMIEQTLKQAQKLLYADVMIPELDDIEDGDLWEMGEYEHDDENADRNFH